MQIDRLKGEGAKPVLPSYSTAHDVRGDLIFKGDRLLVTPNDEDYATYASSMEKAGLPYLKTDKAFKTADVFVGSDKLVVGRVPRDARPFEFVARSLASETGTKPQDICFELGKALRAIAETSDLAPDPQTFSINNVLVLRLAQQIMILPPLSLKPVNDHTREELAIEFRRQVERRLKSFHPALLSNAFEKGLDYDD